MDVALAEKPRISRENFDTISEKLRSAKKITAHMVARILKESAIQEADFVHPNNSASSLIDALENEDEGLAEALIKLFARYTDVDIETIATTNKTVETTVILTKKINAAVTRGAKTAEVYPLMLKLILLQNAEIAKLIKSNEEVRTEMRALKIKVMSEQSL